MKKLAKDLQGGRYAEGIAKSSTNKKEDMKLSYCNFRKIKSGPARETNR